MDHMNVPVSDSMPRTIMNASNILKNFSFPEIQLSPERRLEWDSILFDSLITEYDARRLYWHLKTEYPRNFETLSGILDPWLRDEIDHAYGFALIYASYTGQPLDEVTLKAEIRSADFRNISTLLGDPLILLVMMAYDEIITTHVYHRSIKHYDNFKSPSLSKWIRKTKADEIKHFFSFISKAKALFPSRMHEIPSILETIFKIDFQKTNYSGTFVLDHNTPDFPLSELEIETVILPVIIKKMTS